MSSTSLIPLFLLAGASTLVLIAVLFPRLLSALYEGLRRLGRGMAGFVSSVAFFSLFVVMVVPIALVRRLSTRDPLARRFDPKLPTYFTKRAPRSPEHMRRPF